MEISTLRKRLSEITLDPGEQRNVYWSWFTNSLAGSHMLPARLRTLIYRTAGLQIALTSLIRPGVVFRDRNVTIGPGSTINYRCTFDNRVGVTIGKNVGVGIGVVFLNTDHDTSNPAARAGRSQWAAVNVGDGSFIGSGCTILPGVSVGQGCVIAAGAVVIRDCKPNSLYAGVPARWIKDLPEATAADHQS